VADHTNLAALRAVLRAFKEFGYVPIGALLLSPIAIAAVSLVGHQVSLWMALTSVLLLSSRKF